MKNHIDSVFERIENLEREVSMIKKNLQMTKEVSSEMTLGEVADYLQLQRGTVYQYIAKGKLNPSKAYNGRLIFQRSEIEGLVKK
jgi:excisionase family DNA binding protein